MKDLPASLGGNDDGSATAYMCLTDFEFGLKNAFFGKKIYPSLANLRKNNPYAKDFGIVEVRVSAVRVVQEAAGYDEGEE